MQLNAPNRALVRQAVLNNPTAKGYLDSGNSYDLREWLNSPRSPVALAWRVDVAPYESDEAPDYSTFDTISAGKRESWSRFLAFPRNFTKPKVRKWILDVWGNATNGSNAEAILQAGTFAASNAQFAIGGTARTAGTVSALELNFTGKVDDEDAAALIGNFTGTRSV